MTEKEKTSYFNELVSVDVKDKVEKKNGLNYLSWAWAWAEVCKRYPSATYEVVKFDGIPYVYDIDTGYMVYTRVTLDGITREMWLPVMDGNNKAMKNRPYEIMTKYGKKITVEAATMFDINKTIMRCLTKNLGMFGLGLSLYAGEDIGGAEDTTSDAKTTQVDTKTTQAKETVLPKKPAHAVRAEFVDYCKANKIEGEELLTICKMFKLNNEASDDKFNEAIDYCKEIVKKRNYVDELASYADSLATETLSEYPEEV